MDAMNGMIYEQDTPVTFELDDNAKEQKVNEFLDWVCREYGESMWEFFRENFDGILENKLVIPWNGFPVGMKLSKVLMKEFGLDAEDVRQKLSMLIQSNKVTGTLCLSVHPLDFLSASENECGWRSCHALDGEYRAGNVSYMVDNCTIMAYLKSKEDVVLPRFPADVPWNNKKWRCYFYVDNHNGIIYAARQYPFHSDAALEHVAKLLNQFFYFDDSYRRECQEESKYLLWRLPMNHDNPKLPMMKHFNHWGIRGMTNINGLELMFDNTKFIVGNDSNRKIVPPRKFIQNHPDACCFNDVYQSHTYAPWMMVYRYDMDYMPAEVDKPLIVGGPCTCVSCGKEQFGDSDTFLCKHCREGEDYTVTCERCGAVDFEENMVYTDGWGYLCSHCLDYIEEHPEEFEN